MIIGAAPDGRKELLGFHVEFRESAQIWREFLIDIRSCELAIAPEVAVGNDALGFWKAVDEVIPQHPPPAVWFHKISNVLNKLPKSMAPAVTFELQDIHHAETNEAAQPPAVVSFDAVKTDPQGQAMA